MQSPLPSLPPPGQVPPSDLAFVGYFFVYGLALFALGLAVALETRHSSDIPLAASLKYLAAFGFFQAAAEWLDAALILEGGFSAPGESSPARVLGVALLVASATSLLLFGSRLLAGCRPGLRWTRFLPWLLLAGWVASQSFPGLDPIAEVGHVGGTSCLECHRWQSSAHVAAAGSWLTGAEAWARYLLYFPGSLLAALALLAQRPLLRGLGPPRIGWYSVGAAAGFAASAVFAGLVVAPAPYVPASLVNYATFSQVLGLPPQLTGAGAAVAVAYCVVRLLNVFEVERRRQLLRADQERFAAQQRALEAERRAQAELADWNRQLEARIQERTRELEAAHAELQARAVDVAVLEERDRISRELHDSLAQALGYVGLRASVLAGQLAADQPERAAAEAELIQQVADDAYADVREAILGLRVHHARRELVATLDEYLRKYSLQSGIRSELLVASPEAGRFPPAVEIQLVRLIQEALTNVRKHAGAERVRIRLWREESRALVAVEDDGCGFDPAAAPPSGHFGLATMRERAQSVGGLLRIESAPGQGTRVLVSLPAPAAGAAPESADRTATER